MNDTNLCPQSFLIFPTKTNRLLHNTRVVRHKIAGEPEQQGSSQVGDAKMALVHVGRSVQGDTARWFKPTVDSKTELLI